MDRRFTATLKQLTTLQAQHRAAATARVTPPATTLFEPNLQHALDRFLRDTVTAPANPVFDLTPPPAPASTGPAAPAGAAPDPAPILASTTAPDPGSPPAAPRTASAPAPSADLPLPVSDQAAAPLPAHHPLTATIMQNEANALADLGEDQLDAFLDVLLRDPRLRSSIPAFYLDALVPADGKG